MTFEYHASKTTNMDCDDSKIAYKQHFDAGSESRYSAFPLRNSPFKVATVCLGLLCVLLLAGVIGQSVHYRNVGRDHDNNVKAMSREKENLQQSLKAAQKEKKDLEVNRNQLQQNYDYLAKRRDQIQTNNNLLTEETNQLKLTQSQVETSNTALKKELDEIKITKNQLQKNNDALTVAKNLLQNQYDSVLKRKTDLQANYDSVSKDRDVFHNKFNNATRSREQLQLSYNDLIKKVEHLQVRYNVSASEKDMMVKSHKNMTVEMDTLQAAYDIVKKAENELQATFMLLAKERDELESSLKNVTAERDLLQVKNDNITVERDQLLGKVNQLNETIEAKACPTGWRKFEFSCYFTSVSKKTWTLSREYCQSKGADLAIIKSPEEMAFINSLHGHDKEVWIGLSDGGAEGQWKWVDGTPMNKSYWGKGQPNSYDGRNQDCVEFWHRATGIGDWNDESCTIEQQWICEM
ncbi:CD209 antigen-like [Brachyistius frenatus]|uniref:CD209 antigen-like n=1 Tax=Brachyistius frenatus TaxID=100188 RepID=UPI0037E6FA50